MSKDKKKLIFIITILATAVLAVRLAGLDQLITLENTGRLEKWISQFGIWGPVIFVSFYILACLFFLPALPITLMGALAFGPIKGAIFSSVGSTLGAVAAFLLARYGGRDFVKNHFEDKKLFQKIDEGFKKNGWQMLMITRLIPIFPFNLQNFAYGLTSINLLTYAFVSWLCMIPGTVAYNFMAGSLVSGGGFGQSFLYLLIGSIIFVLISFLPRIYKHKIRNKLGDQYDG